MSDYNIKKEKNPSGRTVWMVNSPKENLMFIKKKHAKRYIQRKKSEEKIKNFEDLYDHLIKHPILSNKIFKKFLGS